tara:strand:- start:1 stop:198 length:198 start_codon:yes stop_codon:yes gene_type:complete
MGDITEDTGSESGSYNINEEYDNNIFNLCRLIFYVPIIFFGSVIASITYDYITFKDDINSNKKSD